MIEPTIERKKKISEPFGSLNKAKFMKYLPEAGHVYKPISFFMFTE